MRMVSETTSGWIGSIVFHLLLLLIFLFVNVPEIIQRQEFIEVVWGSPAATVPSLVSSQPETASPSPKPAVTRTKQPGSRKPASQPVILPTRRMAQPAEDLLPLKSAEKLEASERGSTKQTTIASGIGERDLPRGKGSGNRERVGPVSGSSGSSFGPTITGSGGLGGDVDQGISFSIQWSSGGTRRRIGGDLPKYPGGVNVEAQIKILTVVLPDGSVKSAQPAQKANTKLEDAAMREVRYWRFEPLRSSHPQEEQSCLITFLFRLK